ncbi:glycosyltransferase family 2 protein [Nibrella saemangeumensis]|uniref:Glycosyltransferase family 2 protein n=1 Tax=Nibrella saemangeumensis TaxID=1084526 RepID=A0ABP8MNX1_9BACT
MITFNSERVLPDVLQALAWCDEIVIVDSGSTDCTLGIAGRFGCRVIHRAFDGFGAQKGFAVTQASHDWVLVVDADEIVTPELRDEMRQRVGREKAVGYAVPISLVFLNKLMRYGGEYKMPHLRLFNRQYGNYNTNRVHEDVVLNGPVARLQNHMLHHSYGSLHEYFEKFNRYTTAGARDLASRQKKGSLVQVVFRLPITFFKEYILKLNLLNGYPGFLWSLFSAMYPVVKYAKLREMQKG